MFVSLIVTTGLFALLFRFVPDVHLRWRDVMIGALAIAVVFTIGQQLIGLYLGQSSMASSYGAAGSGDDPPAVGVLLVPDPAARCRVHPPVRSARRHEAGPGVLRGKRPWRPQLSVTRPRSYQFMSVWITLGLVRRLNWPASTSCRDQSGRRKQRRRSSRAANTAYDAPALPRSAAVRIADLCVWTRRGLSGADPRGWILRSRWIAQRR